jgi:hypothetical protein
MDRRGSQNSALSSERSLLFEPKKMKIERIDQSRERERIIRVLAGKPPVDESLLLAEILMRRSRLFKRCP